MAENKANHYHQEKLLPVKAVTALTSLGRSTIYRLMEAKLFPRPVRPIKSRIAWRSSDIATWMEALKSGEPSQ